MLYKYGLPQGQDSSGYQLLATVPPLRGRSVLTRGTAAVIDIHNTSLARPLQIEYPAVLKKTMCFWGAKYNPSPSPLGPRNGSEGGKTGGRRVRRGVMGLPGFHIRDVWGVRSWGVEGVSKAHEPRVWLWEDRASQTVSPVGETLARFSLCHVRASFNQSSAAA